MLHTIQPALGFSGRKYALLERIKRLNTKTIMKTRLTEKLIAGAVVLSTFILLSFIIDGGNQFIKDEVGEEEVLSDTTATKKLVVVKTTIDITGKKPPPGMYTPMRT
jgi:hypothetical protein